MWSLIVLASVLLIFSITANWVQREALDTDEVVDTTDQILADQDVQEALSIYLVDQVYANVDVQAQLEQELPSSAKALSAPLAAATRQLALNVSEKALASPRVQALVSNAVRVAHEQFVKLIEDEGQYVSTTGGDVTIEYGTLVADLAARLGVDPATISQIQGIVQDLSKNLKQGLTAAQDQIKSVRAELAQVQGGSLSPQLQQDLKTLQTTLADLQTKVASLEKKVKSAEGKAPSQLQDRLTKLESRLSDLDTRLTAGQDQVGAVLEDPSQANVEQLDAALASTEERVTTLLARQAVQTPGQLVVIESDQLDGVQTAVRALRNLGFVLPLLVLLLYVGALYLARGWRRRALIAAGGGILVATLLVAADEAPDRQRGRGRDGELRHGQAGRPIRLGHRLGGAAPAGAVRPRDRVGVRRGGPPGRARPSRRRRATLPRTAPARPAGRRLLGRCRAVPALAGFHPRDQQPRPGLGDRCAGGAGRGGYRSAAATDGAGVSTRPGQLLTDVLSERAGGA